jgi:hypothetical protein
MARRAKPANEAPAETQAASKEGPKYGVNELVEATDLQPASVRVALRELGVKKEFGNKYGWNTKKDFDEVVKAMKERSAKRVAQPKEAEKPKPAKGKATTVGKGRSRKPKADAAAE